MIEKIKRWWNGDLITYEGEGYFGVSYDRHWTSRFAHWFLSLFLNPNRRAVFLAVLGFITFIFMLFKFFSDTHPQQDTTQPNSEDRKNNTPIHTKANQ